MSFLDALRKSMEDEVVITHSFLLEYNPGNNIIHAFFEGKTDESFYGTFIRRFKPKGWKYRSYVCGNKDSVYYHYEKLSSKHKTHQPLLFFVDKDIDDIVPVHRVSDEKIYVTSFYSVENYVVTSESIDQIWSEIFRQSSGTTESEKLLDAFKYAHQTVQEILLEMMSWVLGHRREGSKPNLDCIVTKKLFYIDDMLRLRAEYNTIDELTHFLDKQTNISTPLALMTKINECKKELQEFEPKKVIRGHNEMDFFIEFVKKLKNVVAKESGNKIKTNVEITTNNILDLMGPRVPIPKGLYEFLKMHLQNEEYSLEDEKTLTMT